MLFLCFSYCDPDVCLNSSPQGISHSCKEDAILATNSLYMDITSIMDRVHLPEVRMQLTSTPSIGKDADNKYILQR